MGDFSHRRVVSSAMKNRIPGAQRAGGRWIIPEMQRSQPMQGTKRKYVRRKRKNNTNRKGGAEQSAKTYPQHQRGVCRALMKEPQDHTERTCRKNWNDVTHSQIYQQCEQVSS
jgi:hypothetical protein